MNNKVNGGIAYDFGNCYGKCVKAQNIARKIMPDYWWLVSNQDGVWKLYGYA